MSHSTTIKSIAIRDVSAMKQAVASLKAQGINCELLEKAKPRMYYSAQSEKCDYVLQLKDGEMDVGFKAQEDGSFAPVLDVYGGHVRGQIGAACPMPKTTEGRAQHAIGKFQQEYSRSAAINSAVQQGFSVESEEQDEEGNYHITLTGM